MLKKKMLIYDDGSRNVYENNRNTGIMPGDKPDIYVNRTCILQKSADFDGQFCLNSAFADVSRADLRRPVERNQNLDMFTARPSARTCLAKSAAFRPATEVVALARAW